MENQEQTNEAAIKSAKELLDAEEKKQGDAAVAILKKAIQ